MENTDSKEKVLKAAKALSLIEGVVFFVAGICTMLTATILGTFSGGALIILGCMSILPVFVGGDDYFEAIGTSLAEDEDADAYGQRIDDMKEANRE